MCHHADSEKCHPCIYSKSTLFQFKTIAPVATCSCENSLPLFLISSLYILEGCAEVSPEPSLLQFEQLQVSTGWRSWRLEPPWPELCHPQHTAAWAGLVLGQVWLGTGDSCWEHCRAWDGLFFFFFNFFTKIVEMLGKLKLSVGLAFASI